jgi:CheY-like chemotaxis protein
MNPAAWKVFLVEDEFDSVQMVSKILSHAGAQIFVARNGRECLEQVHSIDPTVIIMDLAMPEMDGWETLVELRANPNTAHIPVIAITAYHSDSVQEDAQRVGFDGYFPKPLSPTNFVNHLGNIIAS